MTVRAGATTSRVGPAHVVVLGCGGTIATVPVDGQAVLKRAEELLASVPGLDDLAHVTPRDVLRLPSHLMGLDDLAAVARAARDAAAEPGVDGVVVTHGTDVLEEVAYLTDLWHDGETPIVFTGAQRDAADPAGDGPGNVRDAVRVAADPRARGLGVLVAFASVVLPADAVRKVHTVAPTAFAAPRGRLGSLTSTLLRLDTGRSRPAPLPPGPLHWPVELIALTAGGGRVLVDAALDAGAQGLVLDAFGAGTAPAEVVDVVAEATARGVLVVVTSRCEHGGVWPQPGRGAGADLAAAGAWLAGDLDGIRARMLLLAVLAATGGRSEEAARLLAARLPAPGH